MAGGGILLALLLGGAAPPGGNPGPGPLDLGSILMVGAALLAVAAFWRLRWYRLRDAPRPAPAFSPLIGLAMFYGMFVLGMAGAMLAHWLVVGDQPADQPVELTVSQRSLILIGQYAAQALIVPVLLWQARRASREGPGPARPGPVRSMLIGAGALLLFWPLVQCTAGVSAYLVQRISGEPVEHIAHDTLSLILKSPPGAWLAVMSALVVIAAPLLEEVMYRGILQSTMRGVGLGRWTAIVITSAVFALMHVGVARWHALAALLVLSIGLGWIYEKTGRLEAAMSMHVLFNAANLALGWMEG